MTINITPDDKTISRIHKLLNLARDGGATEGEANAAMAAAERLMLANNLSMAEIEMSGGAATEGRGKHETKGKANYRWQRWLMSAIAEANFCYLNVIVGKRRIRGDNFRDITLGYELIGRVSNVTASQNMYEYLLQTCLRLRRDYECLPGNGTAEGALFIEGMAMRLAERLKDRHARLMEEQRKEAERKKAEQAARASHPAYAGSGTALVVVMEDFAQSERDLNTDMAEGKPPGTTAAKRREREDRWATKDRKVNELVASGIKWDVAWFMVNMDWDQERATKYHEAQEAQAAREEAANKGKKKSRASGGRSREDRLYDRLYTGAAADGRRKAESVGFDEQLSDNGKGRRIA